MHTPKPLYSKCRTPVSFRTLCAAPCLPSYSVICSHIYFLTILIPLWYAAPALHSQCTVNAQHCKVIAQLTRSNAQSICSR